MGHNLNHIKRFLQDIEESGTTYILDSGSEKDEVMSIAKAKGILVKDSIDLAAFKNVYALVNKANKNKMILDEAAVKEALETFPGKPINLNHTDKIIGYYIEYKYIEKTKEIIGYGILFKSFIKKDYERMKSEFKKGKLKTSYEIWYPKNTLTKDKDGNFIASQIQFGGGAILLDKPPAFDEAAVKEMAALRAEFLDTHVLSSATENEYEILTANSQILEEKMDFEKMFAEVKKVEDITDEMKAAYTAASDEDKAKLSAEVTALLQAEPVKTEANAQDMLLELMETKKKVDEYKAAMEDYKKKYDETTAAMVERDSKQEEVNAKLAKEEEAYSLMQEALAKLEAANKEIAEKLTVAEKENAELKANEEKIKAESEAKVKMYRESAQLILTRRSELGDVAKDMADEQILDDKDFEIASLRKKVAELDGAVKTTASETVAVKPEDKPSDDKLKRFAERDAAVMAVLNQKGEE